MNKLPARNGFAHILVIFIVGLVVIVVASGALVGLKRYIQDGNTMGDKTTHPPDGVNWPTQGPDGNNGDSHDFKFSDQKVYGFSFANARNSSEKAVLLQTYADTNSELFRFGADWATIEAVRGTYDWQSVDETINWPAENDIRLLLTLRTNAPDWALQTRGEKGATIKPENYQDFQNFVTALLERYGDKIHIIQIGNEWQSKTFFPGTAEEFKTINNLTYDTIKSAEPGLPVALGGFSASSLRILGIYTGTLDHWRDNRSREIKSTDQILNDTRAQAEYQKMVDVMDGAKYNIIDAHLYFDMDDWDEHITTLRTFEPTKPIIVTEWCATHPIWHNDFTDAGYAANMQTALDKLAALEIVEAYHFRTHIGEGQNDLFTHCGIMAEGQNYPLLYETYKSFMLGQ